MYFFNLGVKWLKPGGNDSLSYSIIHAFHLQDSLNLIKNSMLFDLGLRPADYHKPDLVRDTVREIDAKFTLVLVYEHLDESLVLLKRKLCWQLDDILHLKFLYLDKEKFARRNITEEQKRQVRTWNAADVMLYEYFNKTLWKSIGDGGNSFRQDLTEFRGIQTAIEKDCLGNVTIDSGNKFVVNPDVSPFNRYLCEKLMTDELQYLNYFRKKLENEKRGGNFEDATFKMSPQNTSAATDDLIKWRFSLSNRIQPALGVRSPVLGRRRPGKDWDRDHE